MTFTRCSLMNRIFFIVTFASILLSAGAYAQEQIAIPVNVISSAADPSKPMIVYITGDGGWNGFSSTLCKNLAAHNYPVVSLNAKGFFWKKKNAKISAQAISSLIKKYSAAWGRDKVLLLGYSFGADVLPFAYNNLPAADKAKVSALVLLSPSGTTDFEVHLTYLFSGTEPNAAIELNTIIDKPVTIITGDDENVFPYDRLKNKNVKKLSLPGGHHYDGNEKLVAETVIGLAK